VKHLAVVSERTTKINNECRKTIDAGSYLFLIILGELYASYHYRAYFSFELQIIKVF
jgi:hypothetical protein